VARSAASLLSIFAGVVAVLIGIAAVLSVPAFSAAMVFAVLLGIPLAVLAHWLGAKRSGLWAGLACVSTVPEYLLLNHAPRPEYFVLGQAVLLAGTAAWLLAAFMRRRQRAT
jgi:hypothetical protein